MEKIPKQQFEFYVYHQKRKGLTSQQKKVKQISEITHVCLRDDVGKGRKSLFKCVMDEAEQRLAS